MVWVMPEFRVVWSVFRHWLNRVAQGDGKGAGSQYILKSAKSVAKQQHTGTGYQNCNKVRN